MNVKWQLWSLSFLRQVCFVKIDKNDMTYWWARKVEVWGVGCLFSHFETRYRLLSQIFDDDVRSSRKRLKYRLCTTELSQWNWLSYGFAELYRSPLNTVWIFWHGSNSSWVLKTLLIVVEMADLEQIKRNSNKLGSSFRILPASVVVVLHAWYSFLLLRYIAFCKTALFCIRTSFKIFKP